MKFLKTFLEKVGYGLYHFTNSGYVANILKNDEISLTSAAGTSSDLKINKGRFFFFSMTRSKSSGYRSGNTKILLDDRKLRNKYKIIPVDYWQWSKDPNEYQTVSSYKSALETEQEDRLVSNDAVIPNASKYILEIHCDAYQRDDEYYDGVSELIHYCNKRDIPLYLYKNKEDFLNQKNPIKNVSSDFEEGDGESKTTWVPKYDQIKLASFLSFNDEKNYDRIVKFMNSDKLKKELDETLGKETHNHYRLGSPYEHEAVYVISNMVHNIRSKPDKMSRFLLKMLSDDMRKHKSDTLEDYFKKKQWVGKKTKGDIKKEFYRDIERIIDNEVWEMYKNNYHDYVEIDGEYYNNAYVSKEIKEVVESYLEKLKGIYKMIIFSNENDILEYSFYMGTDYIKPHFDLNEVKLSDKVNVTDMSYKYEDGYIDKYMKEIFENVIRTVDYDYYEISNKYKEEYKKQFYG